MPSVTTLCGSGSVGSITKLNPFAGPANLTGSPVRKEACKINRLVVELNFTALHLIHVDNIIEDIAQRDRRDVDRFEVFFLLAGQLGIQQNAAQPTMPFSGVRSSWLMVEMKVVLSRLARSSAS